MIGILGRRRREAVALLAIGLGLGMLRGNPAEAGAFSGRRARGVVPTSARSAGTPAPGTLAPGLGSFYSTPYITVRGNFPVGGGYSPLEEYGDSTMALYGPFSPLRSISAPVLTYTRGYDGRARLGDATTSSTPNLPELSPISYPTRSNTYYFGPRRSATPPQWDNDINYLDQN